MNANIVSNIQFPSRNNLQYIQRVRHTNNICIRALMQNILLFGAH